MGLGDLAGMMGQVKEMQQKMQQTQEELRNKVVEASSGGGMVTARMNGRCELLDIKFDAQAVDPQDLEMLEDLTKAAVNAAMEKSQKMMQEEMSKVTGGLNLPGMDQLGKMFQ
jgi:hypothetical protein